MNAAYFSSKLPQRPMFTTSINTKSSPKDAKSNLTVDGTVTRTYKVPTATGSDPLVILPKGKDGKKSKAIPLQAWTDPEGSRIQRLSALGTSRLYPPTNIPGTHFC